VLYAGVNLELDLRRWLERLAQQLAAAGFDDGKLDHSRLRDAADVVGRASRLKSLGELFRDRLGHRQQSGRIYWMVVDAIDSGDAKAAAVAKRWNVQLQTLKKHVRTYGDTVKLSVDLPLSEDSREEVRELAKELSVKSPRRT